MKHEAILKRAIQANHERTFFAQYPENPKAYGEDGIKNGAAAYQALLGQAFSLLLQTGTTHAIGEEVSPYTQTPLAITYPSASVETLIENSTNAFNTWKNKSIDERADLLIDCLETIKDHFFEIAFATMHTTGQSFMMSFQASGPHSNDRALEAIAAGYEALSAYPSQVLWEKPMGKFAIQLQKDFKAIPRGVGLVIGCSTFPIWNTLPGLFADLMTGNSCIVKPHPKAVLPIAIVIAAMQKSLQQNGVDPNLIQLGVDSSELLITKTLCEHQSVQLIDYTGGSSFGNYVEGLKNKTVFTEKAGVNSVIIDSFKNVDEALSNLAFSVSLYSGQMCTAPQNFFIAETVKAGDTILTFEEVADKFKAAVEGLVNNPKAGPGTLGAIQNELTLNRAMNSGNLGTNSLNANAVKNEEFPNARTCSPAIISCSEEDASIYEQELFGPIVLLIKTKNTHSSIKIAKEMCRTHGAITCAAYTSDDAVAATITAEMESVFAPVSLNLTGFIWVNQHAAFSDFHVTGGNPAGNASFTNSDFVNRRFVWVGHRKVVA